MLNKSRIEKLNKCLYEYCQPLSLRLLSPLDKDRIKFFFEQWQIDDENLSEIFLWKDGIPYDESLPTYSFNFTGFGVIPPLEEINKIIKIESSNPYWRKTLFPLVTSFAGDFLLYETDKSSDVYGQIFLYSPNLGYVDYQVSYFDSVNSMIDTIVENFEKKVFVYNPIEMSLDIDFTLHFEISKVLNPNSEYWQQ